MYDTSWRDLPWDQTRRSVVLTPAFIMAGTFDLIWNFGFAFGHHCRNMHLKQDNMLDLISIQIWTCSGNEETIRAGLLQWAGVDWQCRAQTNQIYFLNFFLHNYTLIRTIQTRLRSTCHIVHHHVLGCLSSGGRKESHGNSPLHCIGLPPKNISLTPHPIQVQRYAVNSCFLSGEKLLPCPQEKNSDHASMLPRVKPCCQATNLTSRLLSDDETAPPMHLQVFKLC